MGCDCICADTATCSDSPALLIFLSTISLTISKMPKIRIRKISVGLKRLILFAIAAFVFSLFTGILITNNSNQAANAQMTDTPTSLDPSTSVTDTISQITSKPLYTHSTWGYEVSDLATGEALLSQTNNTMFVTGSILKAYSTAAALAAYTPDYRFQTPVYGIGAIQDGVLTGNLVLVASGDFSFGLRDQADGTLAFNSLPEVDHNYADTGLPGPVLLKDSDPLAALNQLAAQVQAAGIREVQGDVIIDDRLFETFDGWPDGSIAPIWVNENVLDITVTPAGQQVTVDWRPQTAAYSVRAGDIQIVPAGGETQLNAELVQPGVVQISGQVAADANPLQIWQIPNPADFARTAFIQALARAGITVSAIATGANPTNLLPPAATYSEAQKLAEHTSPPLSEFTKVILKVSYNRAADLMVCLVAVQNGDRDCPAGIAPVITTITQLGVSQNSTFMFDGAGSDERDRTTPTDMTTFLRAVAQQPYGVAFREGLPILGVDGTLATNQKGSPAAGKVQAKTGSRIHGTPDDRLLITGLTHIGYIEAESGRQLVSAVMLRDVPVASPDEIFAADGDLGALEAAVQQGF
nr:MAG: D-alanyl-D-alanine carboxypeptidase/D-alanyl-D-alanine-endopeptidase [Leptolyngbya sp. IPPAS B-1204]